MSKGQGMTSQVPQSRGIQVGSRVKYRNIDTPGAYISEDTGDLFRFTGSALNPGHSPNLWIESTNPQMFVKISDDPAVQSEQAALYCGSHNIAHNIPT